MKYTIGVRQTDFLGHYMTVPGVHPVETKINIRSQFTPMSIHLFERPANVKVPLTSAEESPQIRASSANLSDLIRPRNSMGRNLMKWSSKVASIINCAWKNLVDAMLLYPLV